LNLVALLLCIDSVDYVILGLGILALLFSIGFNKVFYKFDETDKKLNRLSLLIGLTLSSLPMSAALLSNFFYDSVKSAQVIFIISAYIIGMSATAIYLLKNAQSNGKTLL
jgi:hypothetical protein